MPGSMSYSAGIIASPYSWLFVSALFLGAALQRATRRARPRFLGDDPERARTAKWLFFSFFLSLAVVLALGAVFVPGPQRFNDLRLSYFYLASTALFFLVFRFKKSAGLAVVLLALALVFVLVMFLRSLVAFTGETEIGRVRVLAARDDRMKLELAAPPREPVILSMDGRYFAPIVKVVIFDDLFVFLGAHSWYRFEGLTSFALQKGQSGQSFRQQNTDYHFPEPQGISERLWQLYERNEGRIHGVKSVQVEMDLKRARELASYSLRIENDGGLQIVELH
jgi:hypothetical protein